MKIYYVHHALRDRGNPPTQDDNITELGIQDAKLSGEIILDHIRKRNTNVVAIFTAPEFRHMETSRLVNESLRTKIIQDRRLSEMRCNDKNETWIDVQTRVRQAIKDVVMKYDDEDVCAVMVTSGVNIAAFMSVAYGLAPSNETPFLWVHSCSQIGFDINKRHFLGE